jgi:hypothetical protein
MKGNLQSLHVQKNIENHKIELFVYDILQRHDNKYIDPKFLQVMCCVLCYITPILILNPKNTR